MSTTSGPRTIYIIRHAEKPSDAGTPALDVVGGRHTLGIDAAGAVNDHSLTPRGWQRAGALAVLFGAAEGPLQVRQFPRPTTLFAPDYGSARESAQHRAYQTIEPLSLRLGVPVFTPVAKGDENALVDRHVLHAHDADVLICWEHDHISRIVTALSGRLVIDPPVGVDAHWPDERFDMVLMLRRADDGTSGYRFSQLPQLVLDGDSSTPLPTF
jgi:hypothetical protein